jgi:hypothetical protein
MFYTNEKRVVDGTKLTKDYDLNKLNTSGWYTVTNPKNCIDTITDAKLFVIVPNDKKYVTQFLFGNNDKLGSMWFRSGNGVDWSKWKEVSTSDLYLALAGGTITGDLTVNGNIIGKFAGHPTAPDADANSTDEQIANIKYVKEAIKNLVNASPAALDTLKELATAIGNDPNFAATMTAKLAEKFDKVGGVISGDTTISTKLLANNIIASTQTVTGDITVNGNIHGHLAGNADTATRATTAATADKTQAAISFKNTDNITSTFDGSSNLDLTSGVYYAKESSHTINADEATHAKTASTVHQSVPANQIGSIISGDMAGTDFFRIVAGGTDDNGYISFDVADNGNEPIYVRQYSGPEFTSVTHQVTLLDGSGNTSFPGTVLAPTFSGHLAGTADTATNATHATNTDNANLLVNSGLESQFTSGQLTDGLRLTGVYNNGYPTSYGNILNVGGGGDGQILCGWSGSNRGIEHLYYRNRRDAIDDWSDWKTVAFTTDTVSAANTCVGNSATASVASKLGRDGDTNNPMLFHWNGRSGQPSWLWGSNDGTDMYVWNPSNFSVNYASSAGNANTVGGYTATQLKQMLSGHGTPNLTAIVDWDAMARAVGYSPITKTIHGFKQGSVNTSQMFNLVNAGSGIFAYGGDADSGSLTGANRPFYRGDIIFRQSWRNFDKLLIHATNDVAAYAFVEIIDTWQLYFLLTNPSWAIELFSDAGGCYWRIVPYNVYGTDTSFANRCSNDMRWYCFEQNCGIIEIYGISY